MVGCLRRRGGGRDKKRKASKKKQALTAHRHRHNVVARCSRLCDLPRQTLSLNPSPKPLNPKPPNPKPLNPKTLNPNPLNPKPYILNPKLRISTRKPATPSSKLQTPVSVSVLHVPKLYKPRTLNPKPIHIYIYTYTYIHIHIIEPPPHTNN